jgi:predicted cobalt transporter CbtA
MVPEALEHRFVAAVIVTSLLFWAVLGAATGGFYRRFAPQAWH